jgi:DNA repair exonuclease SbcCD nuclease subunit
MSLLLTSDVHFSDAPLAAYRWELLPWLAKEAQRRKVDAVAILGDLTDAKDRHPAPLVNKLVDGMAEIAKHAKLILLKANHDYIDEEWPFFRFLRNMPNVKFVVERSVLGIGGAHRALFLPHTRTPEEDWRGMVLDQYDIVFCHQTFDGAKSENGMELRGTPPGIFQELGFKGKVWSGDIHVPQKVNKQIEYVGSPYRVHFGDSYDPRVILLDNDLRPSELTLDTLFRHTFDISSLDDLKALAKDATSGDQVKIRVALRRSQFPAWPELRRDIMAYAAKRDWVVCGLEPKIKPEQQRVTSRDVGVASKTLTDPKAVLDEYCQENAVEKGLRVIGTKLLEKVL